MHDLRQQYNALNDNQVEQKKALARTAVTRMFDFGSRLPLLGISIKDAIQIRSRACTDILKDLVDQLYEDNADGEQALVNIQRELSRIVDKFQIEIQAHLIRLSDFSV
jgi:hypothetical protein